MVRYFDEFREVAWAERWFLAEAGRRIENCLTSLLVAVSAGSLFSASFLFAWVGQYHLAYDWSPQFLSYSLLFELRGFFRDAPF